MKFRITHTLLSSWLYSMTSDERYNEFIDYLNRKPTPQTSAMRDGIMFENMVYAHASGASIPEDCEWRSGIEGVADKIKGSVFQVPLSKDITVDGVDFHLFGILDALGAGHIYDVKFSKTYRLNKYFGSTQHPMYFALCPEALDFTYVISDGDYVYTERYYPRDTVPIEYTVHHFMQDLERQKLVDIYAENFKM